MTIKLTATTATVTDNKETTNINWYDGKTKRLLAGVIKKKLGLDK